MVDAIIINGQVYEYVEASEETLKDGVCTTCLLDPECDLTGGHLCWVFGGDEIEERKHFELKEPKWEQTITEYLKQTDSKS